MDEVVQPLLAYKGAAVAAWLALLFAAERWRPAAPRPEPGADEPRAGWRRLARNAGLWAVNAGMSPLVVVPVSLWASSHALGWRPDWWSGLTGLALDLLILDFWIYWWHRANHEIPLLWRFHEVHHLDRFLDTTSAVRFHFGEVLLSAGVRAAVIVAAGLPASSVLVFETLVLVSALFHHANLALPPRLESALSRVVVTPSIHWVHHHRKRVDTDSNYATVLSLWDPLFGTRSATRRWPAMPIGTQGREERGLGGLLASPFRARNHRVANASGQSPGGRV
ncbi:MAG: sterol desaturase family protein [Azospirillaceae bacterium]